MFLWGNSWAVLCHITRHTRWNLGRSFSCAEMFNHALHKMMKTNIQAILLHIQRQHIALAVCAESLFCCDTHFASKASDPSPRGTKTNPDQCLHMSLTQISTDTPNFSTMETRWGCIIQSTGSPHTNPLSALVAMWSPAWSSSWETEKTQPRTQSYFCDFTIAHQAFKQRGNMGITNTQTGVGCNVKHQILTGLHFHSSLSQFIYAPIRSKWALMYWCTLDHSPESFVKKTQSGLFSFSSFSRDNCKHYQHRADK